MTIKSISNSGISSGADSLAGDGTIWVRPADWLQPRAGR